MIHQTIDFLPVMGIALIPGIITWGLEYLLSLSDILLLSVQIILYPCLVAVLSVSFRIPAFFELVGILKDKLTVANFVKTISKE